MELDQCLETYLPRVSQLFRECGVLTMLFATTWILTLCVLPNASQCFQGLPTRCEMCVVCVCVC